MGIYAEYLNTLKDVASLEAERKKLLKKISSLRAGRDILTISSDIDKRGAPTGIDYSDLMPIADQVDGLKGEAVDVILETGGGIGEIAEEIVRMLWGRFKSVSFIVPGQAKSAGTIMVLAGEEILMSPSSSLGPIDAQLIRGGRQYSAEAFLEGFQKIKKESAERLNKAYVPILQDLSPGDIQAAENALKFGVALATEWLACYKFREWKKDGKPVSDQRKRQRAKKIARTLGSHSKWLSHGRSLKIDDLQKMELRITDVSQIPDLHDALKRYYVVLRRTFEMTAYFKLYETPASQIYRSVNPIQNNPPPKGRPIVVDANFQCPKCQNTARVQANVNQQSPIKKGFLPFPKNDILVCPVCKRPENVAKIRAQIEKNHGQIV